MVTYELTSKKIKGDFTITFKDGYLNGVKIEFKDCLNPEQHELLFGRIPFAENDLQKLSDLGFTITHLTGTHDKITMFCRLYLEHVGVKYNVSGADAGKMKQIKVTQAILLHYFTSTNFIFKGKYSINNLRKYWNELLAEMAATDKPRHPDHYSAEYVKKIDQAQWPSYWAYLRSLGLQPKKDRTGNTIDWVKK